MLRKLILAGLLATLAFASAPSHAQPVKIVSTCGTVSPAFATTTTSGVLVMDVNGLLCTAASVSASITGFPTTQTTGTPISVSTVSATGTLPAGAVVVASNVGATNGAYCKLGASATTSDQLIPPNSWFAFTVGANTQLSCITSTSTTTVNMVGGSGLPTGSGGGGGGGSSSIVNWGGGVLGAMANYGTSPGAVLVPGVNAFVTNTLAAVANNANGVTPAAGAASPVVNYAYGYNAVGSVWDRAVLDACERVSQSYANGVITSATTTRIITPSASNKTYICSMLLTASAADNVGIVEGTGGTCGTATAGVIGGTTAANGPNFTANGGLMMQAGGKVAVAQTAGTNVDFCLITSTAGPLTYSVKYVQAP